MADPILPQQRAAFPPDLDLRAIIEAPHPPVLDFVLPGFLAGTVGALVSPGGAGKSMLALQLAASVAGADTLGLDVPTGHVQIIALEDPAEPLAARLWDLGRYLSPSMREALYEQVHITSLFGHQFDIMDPYCMDWLMAKSQGCRLVVLDTMRRIHQLDENDGGSMASVLSKLEIVSARGASVLALHHSSKAAALGGQGDLQQASRGSSVLVDNIRSQQNLVGLTDDELAALGIDADLKGYYVKLVVSKSNYSAPQPARILRRHAGGILQDAEVATNSVTMTKKQKAAAAKKGGRREQA